MPAEPFDPFAPPRVASAAVSRPERGRWWREGIVRVVAVVAGFSLVADPTALPGVETAAGRALGGYVAARGVGLALLGLGFLPWRWSGVRGNRAATIDPTTEIEEL